MGMNETGDRFVPIADASFYEKLEGDQTIDKLVALERMMKMHGARPPLWRVGEGVEIRGVNFRVVDISEQRLILRPLGFVLAHESAVGPLPPDEPPQYKKAR